MGALVRERVKEGLRQGHYVNVVKGLCQKQILQIDITTRYELRYKIPSELEAT